MSANSEHSIVSVSLRGSGGFTGQSAEPTVVWLSGEHDVSNATQVSHVIAETIALDDEDVIVDLGGVSFIGGATIAILVRANAFLQARSRNLILRSPRRSTVRLLGLCGLAHLISPPPVDGVIERAGSQALRTWVDVPTEEREQKPPADAAQPAPARVGVPAASELAAAADDARKSPTEIL